MENSVRCDKGMPPIFEGYIYQTVISEDGHIVHTVYYQSEYSEWCSVDKITESRMNVVEMKL